MPFQEESRPRIFVSSVVEGFENYREAARRGIETAGGEPILVNEDFPSLPNSSRNACLDAVDSADAYIAIIGERGGWTAPSGRLVVEEEYERARDNKLPILVFVQRTERDPEAKRLLTRFSDYVEGHFRVEFDRPEGLEEEVQRALEPVINGFASSMNDSAVQQAIHDPYQMGRDPSLRFVLAPERSEEVVDPVTLESDDFRDVVYQIAHRPDVRLFSYERSKQNNVVEDTLVIVQMRETRSHQGSEDVRLEIRENGVIVVDVNVSETENAAMGGLSGMVVALDELTAPLEASLRFCGAFYQDIDKYNRHQRFGYNGALVNLGQRSLVEHRPAGQQQSMQVPLRRSNEPLVAYNDPRVVSRADLRSPGEETRRALTRVRRKYES